MNSNNNLLDVSYEQDPLRATMPQQQQSSTSAANSHAASTNPQMNANANAPRTHDSAGIMGMGMGGNPTDLTANANAILQPEEQQEQAMVMGGTSGSAIAYRDDILTDDDNGYADPGRIGEDHLRATNANSTFQNARSNIVINADSVKEETNLLEGGKNAFQSFIGQVTAGGGTNADDMKSTIRPTKVELNAQVKQQHQEYTRKYQGLPSPTQDKKYYNLNLEPCTHKFLVTKVRNWRAGYVRVLSLHSHTYFTTLDLDHEITNLWYYSHVRNYMAVPQEKDCITIDVVEDNNPNSTGGGRGAVIKLKFKCEPMYGGREAVLTAFSERVTAIHGLGVGPRLGLGSPHPHPSFMHCQRLTQRNHSERLGSALLCAPYGLIELDPNTALPIRTYYYKNIQSIAFLNDDENGIVFYVSETAPSNSNNSEAQVKMECKVWFVFSERRGGSGRSELITVLKNKFQVFGLPLVVSESVGVNFIIQSKLGRSQTSQVGEPMGIFPVRKITQRKQIASATNNPQNGVGKYLVITRNGFLMELNGDARGSSSVGPPVVSCCRRMQDIANVVRHAGNPLNGESKFTIEYKGGLCRTYLCNDIDSVIVPILDVSVNMCENFNLTVSNVPFAPYRMMGYAEDDLERSDGEQPAQNMFQQEPMETQQLRKVHTISSVAYAYVEHMYHLDTNVTIQQISNECSAIVTCCHEFNANVSITTACAMPNEKKYVEESINGLWGICSILMKYTSGDNSNEESLGQVYHTMIPIFQTLYRLMMTEAGFASTAKNQDVVDIIFEIWSIKDPFALYWSLKCLSALLLPRPFSNERNTNTEFLNKGFLLHSTSNVMDGLIKCMIEKSRKDDESVLVTMVCSNIVQSILCSHHDTTSPDQMSSFVKKLSKEHEPLMKLIQSSTSMISENITIILRVVANHSREFKLLVRESALTSGTLLKQFYHAIFSPYEGQRVLSRCLCGMWMNGADSAERHLLGRMIPAGFFSYLKMPPLSLEEEEQLDSLEWSEEQVEIFDCTSGSGTNIVRLRLRMKIAETEQGSNSDAESNFRIFFHVLTQDHSLPDLIWSSHTRTDLETALVSEIKSIQEEIAARGGSQAIAWNHEQFRVPYPSLEKELKVGSVYMRLWLEASDSFIKTWDDPVRLFELLFRKLLCEFDRNVLVTNICLRCIGRLYAFHGTKIGPFPDISILLRYMRTSKSEATKQRILSLIAVLVGCNDNDNDPKYARGNLEQLLKRDSIHQLCELFSNCQVDTSTHPKDEDKSGAECAGELLTPIQISELALNCLKRLVLVHKSVNSNGVPLFPIPIAKKLICEGCVLPTTTENSVIDSSAVTHSDSFAIICQGLLCKTPQIVHLTAELIQLLVSHNEKACEKLYLTGVFFFAFTYSGADWRPLSKLLEATHLKQNLSALVAPDKFSEISPGESRSFLANLLPKGLLKILMNRGSERFAEIFVQDNFDTPEVIWTSSMKDNLTRLVREHLKDFLEDLKTHKTIRYEYCPIPEIQYERLNDEIFCHNYYLNNLCDEKRFADWPIHDPFSVFCACIKRWEDMQRIVEEDQISYNDAMSVLELKDQVNESNLRGAYSKAARKYYLAKDRKGQDIFNKIQLAYERLLLTVKKLPAQNTPSIVENREGHIFKDADMKGLTITQSHLFPTWLLMKTQLLICKRHASDIGNLKYPYKMLLNSLVLPEGDQIQSTLMSLSRAKFLHTAIDLLFHSCLVSPVNAEELINEGGALVLANLLNSFVSFLASIITQENEELIALQMESLVNVVHTIAGVAYYESGRIALEALPNSLKFSSNWQKCVDLQFNGKQMHGANLLKRFALEGILSMAKSEKLQRDLARTGIMWNLIHSMLDYDPELELKALGTEQFQSSISQIELNYFGGVAARALGMLCGVMGDEFKSPPHLTLYEAIQQVLTKPIARMLQSSDSEDALRTLNLSIATPLRLWDQNMRGELTAFLDTVEKREMDDLSSHLEAVKLFEYSNLADEVNIGGVYIRIFNTMDVQNALRDIADTSHFARSLIAFIGRSIENDKKGTLSTKNIETHDVIDSTTNLEIESVWYPLQDERFLMCVKALRELVKRDGLIDNVMCETYSVEVLISIISLSCEKSLPMISDIMMHLGPKQAFASAFVQSDLLPRLLSSLEYQNQSDLENKSQQKTRWMILEYLVSSTSVAAELVASSGWLELLSIIAGCDRFNVNWTSREGSAKILARLLYDPQTSATAASNLKSFVPWALLTVLKNNGAESFLLTFDKDVENPELMWDTSTRTELCSSLSNLMTKIFDSTNRRILTQNGFNLPPDFKIVYSRAKNELYLGDVYVKLYLRDPSFELCDPSVFLEALLLRWSQEMELFTMDKIGGTVNGNLSDLTTGNKEVVQVVTDAIISTCKLRPFLCLKLVPWGYTKSIITFLLKAESLRAFGVPLLSPIRLLHLLSADLTNVEEMITFVDSNGKRGVVDGMMKAIDGECLHPETAFMIEALKLLFQTALGDVCEHQSIDQPINFSGHMQAAVLAMAPSPAPGSEPVSKLKKMSSDHPLAMMMSETAPVKNKRATKAVRPNERAIPRRSVQSTFHSSKPMMSNNTQQKGSVVSNPNSNSGTQRVATSSMNTTTFQASRSSSARNLQPTTTTSQPHHITSRQVRPQVVADDPLSSQMAHIYTTQKIAPGGSHIGSTQASSNHIYSQSRSLQASQQRPIQRNVNTVHGNVATSQGNFPQKSYSMTNSTPLSQPINKQRQLENSLKTPVSQDQYLRGVSNQSQSTQMGQQYNNQRALQSNQQDKVQIPKFQNQPSQGLSFAPQPLEPTLHHAPQNHVHISDLNANVGHIVTSAAHPITAQVTPNSQHYNQQKSVHINSNPSHAQLPQNQSQYSLGTSHVEQPSHTDERYRQQIQSHFNGNPLHHVNASQIQGVQNSHQSQNLSQNAGHSNQMHSLIQNPPQQVSALPGSVPSIQPVNQMNHTGFSQTPVNTPPYAIIAESAVDKADIDPEVIANERMSTASGAPNCANGRKILLDSVLQCNFLPFLIQSVLENATLSQVTDVKATKRQTIELLHLLLKDPGYGMKYGLILDSIPSWEKYKTEVPP